MIRLRLHEEPARRRRRALERAAGPTLDAKRQSLRAELAVVEALLDDAPLSSLASRLGEIAGSALPSGTVCLSTPQGPVVTKTQATLLELAATLLQRLVIDGAPFDAARDQEHAVRIVEQVLGEGTGAVVQLTAVQREATEKLLSALKSARAMEKQLQTQAEIDLKALAAEFVKILDAALTVVGSAVEATPEEVRAFVLALVQGDLPKAAELALQIAERAGVGPSASALRDAATIGARLAVARDEDEARRILRRLVVPLGPWSESVLFDLNGDIPKLDRNDFNVIGDVLAGYNARTWGIVGNGAVHEYDFSTPDTIAQTSNRDGSIEGWFTLEPSPAWRVELRGAGRFAYYDTTKITLAPGSTQTLADETSWMGRGALLASARYQPGTRFAGGIWLGAGGQYEFYSRLDVGVPGSRQASSLDLTSFSLLLNARIRLQYELFPRILAARVRVDAQRFDMTRDALRVQAVGGVLTTSAPAEAATQTEVQARVFLDADVARFGGFVPSLNGGFDYFMLASTSESRSSLIPVFGAGIRRDAF